MKFGIGAKGSLDFQSSERLWIRSVPLSMRFDKDGIKILKESRRPEHLKSWTSNLSASCREEIGRIYLTGIYFRIAV